MLQALRWILVGGLGAAAATKVAASAGDALTLFYAAIELAIAVSLAASPRIGSWMLVAGALAAIGVSFLSLQTPCGCLGVGTDTPAAYRRLIASMAGIVGLLLARRHAASNHA